VAGVRDDALAELAARQHGVFTTRQLVDLDFSRDACRARLRSGRWLLLYDNVYRMGGAPPAWRGDLLAACFAAGPTALASHVATAALRQLPSGREGVVEITCDRWRRTRHGGLVVHESLCIDDEDRDEVDGIPCTSTARTLFDLARRVSPTMLDANIDAALRRGLVSLDELRRTSSRLATKGRPGGRKFRAAIETRSGSADLPESVPERALAGMLVGQGLPAPVHQFVVRTDGGIFVARVDLAYPEWMIVIEYDSVEHHTGTAAHIRDSARRDAIGDVGYVVLTATVADLRDRGARLARLVRRRRDRIHDVASLQGVIPP
jgi:very-short-patch-repair endonuclease